MDRFPDWMDPEGSGSRFTRRVAVALLTRENGGSRFNQGDDSGDATAVAAGAMGGALPESDELGRATVVDASVGRGAASWVPVVEWTCEVAIGGMVANAAWAALRLAAERAKAILRNLAAREVDVLISRGFAALVAIQWLLELEEGIGFYVEFVDEFSSFAGVETTEPSYVGSEPWLVSLVDEQQITRFLIAVSPGGEVLDQMRLPIGELERIYLRPRPRP